MTTVLSTMPASCQAMGNGSPSGRDWTSLAHGASATCQPNGTSSSQRWCRRVAAGLGIACRLTVHRAGAPMEDRASLD